MATYSIKDLEQITGIKAHTLRIWERRYNIVVPRRTATNIRYYNDDDLKRLLNIALLNSRGVKISRLAQMDDLELQARVLEITRLKESLESHSDQLVLAMVNFDQILFERVLSRAILQGGIEDAVYNLLFPFFQRVGVLWQTGSINPAQEHFVSNLLRQKLFVALDTLPPEGRQNGIRVVFFLREGDLHEIGLLFYAYIAKQLGHKILYLGQSVPIDDLKSAVRSWHADAIFTSFINPFSSQNPLAYLEELNTLFGHLKLGVTGALLKEIAEKIPPSYNVIKSPQEFKEWVNTNSNKTSSKTTRIMP